MRFFFVAIVGMYLSVSAGILAQEPADSTLMMPGVVVKASRGGRTADPARIRLSEALIRARDGLGVADLGPLMPATQVNVNSRGEALFMVRGAPERHVRISQDGIPLTLPWDERADLSLVPTDAISGVVAVRGVGSALGGPNALAGTVELVPFELGEEGHRTELGVQGGESEMIEARLLHARRRGPWNFLAAAAHRTRDGQLVPSGTAAAFNQSPRRQRTNSDLTQTSILLRLARATARGGELRVTLLGMDGEKGVPPETHVADARFWRYPLVRRILLGASASLPLRDDHAWTLDTSVSGDLFDQEIRAYDDATYTTPSLEPGVDYETDADQTIYAQATLTRAFASGATAAAKTVIRHARHRESLAVDGPETTYAQLISSFTAEITGSLGGEIELRGGGGYEIASTPETGDKPSRDATDAAVINLRASRPLGDHFRVHTALSRRSRFPSMREMFSGALGKFVPNPDLAPERQDLAEAGVVWRGGRGEVGVTGFASRLKGGIEKVKLPGSGKQFQRVNVDELQSLGVELIASFRPVDDLSVAAHHTILHARAKEDDEFDRPAEDRADYLSTMSATWAHRSGVRLRLEAAVKGPRHSADATDDDDGLRRLPAEGSWNLRAAYRHFSDRGFLSDWELYVRVNNLADQSVTSQVGLPEAGRMIYAGLRLGFDRLTMSS